MRDCVVAGSGWSGQRMERNRFWQSEGCFTRRFAAVPTQLPQGISRP